MNYKERKSEKRTEFYKRNAVVRNIIISIGIMMLSFAPNKKAEAAEGSFSYYDQLTQEEKTVYDQLKNITPSSGVITLTWPKEYQFTVNNDQEKDAAFAQTNAEMQIVMQNVLDALMKDHEELYWLDIQASSYQCSYSGSGWGESTSWKTSSVEYNVVPSYTQNQIDQTQAMLASITVNGGSSYEKAKSIHDYLCSTVTYDKTYQLAGNRGLYEALIEGKAVCEGYALAFKALCDREGIPNVLVIGNGTDSDGTQQPHMWNYVQMEDQNWYAVDVTWDDQTETYGIFYDYFLSGSDTAASPEFGGLKFSDSHVNSGDFSGAAYKEFAYPPLSAAKYSGEMAAPQLSVPKEPEADEAPLIQQPAEEESQGQIQPPAAESEIAQEMPQTAAQEQTAAALPQDKTISADLPETAAQGESQNEMPQAVPSQTAGTETSLENLNMDSYIFSYDTDSGSDSESNHFWDDIVSGTADFFQKIGSWVQSLMEGISKELANFVN